MILKKKKLTSVNKELDQKYGKEGTPERNAFREKTMAWYYGEILKEKRNRVNLY
ncbi:MAG: hypothetical protein KGV44_00335 [Flavobacteriaceae bacterium]|nr:hypothetical protein [Flavobacteriaceae bacterium]